MPRLAIAALLLATLSGTASAAPCAIMANKPKVLTAANSAIADGGGIVVAMEASYDDGKTEHGAVATWQFADKSTPAITHLAPGLDVLATKGDATLQDASHKAIVSVKHATAKVAELDAPAVKSVLRDAPKHQKHFFVSTDATLTADAPAGALALVVFDKTGATARSWGAVAEGTRTVTVYTSGGCATLPNGTADSAPGDEITLAWVDASGRLSKKSAAIKIGAAK